MTIEQIEANLPNGFHDADVISIAINFRTRGLVLDMQLWVGVLDASDKSSREERRRAILTVTDLVFCVIEPPDARYVESRTMVISSCGEGTPPNRTRVFSGEIPDGNFLHWFYSSSSNSFVHIAAKDASLEFVG